MLVVVMVAIGGVMGRGATEAESHDTIIGTRRSRGSDGSMRGVRVHIGHGHGYGHELIYVYGHSLSHGPLLMDLPRC